MAKKYYAIKKGMDIKNSCEVKNLIVTTWSECLSYVKGVRGAIYKSFPSKEEAEAYLSNNDNLKKGEDSYPEDVPHIYVDGSYNITTEDYGYGVVIIANKVVVHAAYGNGHNEQCNQRQVNGELEAAITGIEYAIRKKYKKVVLFYDYAGVCQHATGAWARNTTLSHEYYEKITELKKFGNIEIIFVKVDSHTGDLFNEIADELAKTGAGVAIEGVVDKAVADEEIFVSSEKVSDTLKVIIKKNFENVKSVVSSVKKSVEQEIVTKDRDMENAVEKLVDLDDIEREVCISKLESSEKDAIIAYLVKKLRN